MHSLTSSFVLGYHGCDTAAAKRVLAGQQFIPSTNEYDWLGHGVYFWEANPQRGLDYAREMLARRRGARGAVRPQVVGAIVEMRLCLDLTTATGLDQVKMAYQSLYASAGTAGFGTMPSNNRDGLRRNLDCAVINTLHDIREDSFLPPVDTVKGAFIEGPPIYEAARFHERTHI